MTISMIRPSNDGDECQSTGGSPSLEALLTPIGAESFFADYWERGVLVVNRNKPDHFADLLTLDEIDRFIATGGLDGEALSMADAKREIGPDDYLFPTGMVDPVRVFGLFADGATIILQQLQLRHGPLAKLCRAMEARFGFRFQTNVYFTPAGSAQGFKPHWDSHDVFVIQVAGSKAWKIYDTPMILPDRTVRFDPKSYELGPVSQSFTLEAGDIAYVPRGVVHDAQSTDGMSLHITLGCMATTWREVLHAAVDALSLKNPEIRRSLPPGFHLDGTDKSATAAASSYKSATAAALSSEAAAAAALSSEAAAAAAFAQIVDALARETDVAALLREFADDLAETRMALVPGQLAELAALPALDDRTRIRPRPDLIYRIEVHDDETVGVYVFGRVLKFPVHVRPELEALLSEGANAIADLSGDLELESRLVLVRRLVKEGLVSIE